MPPDNVPGLYAGSPLFGFGCGFGRTSARAKQTAVFAAGITYPSEALPSANLAVPPRCGGTPKPLHAAA